MKTLNLTAAAVFVVMVFYLLIMGRALLVPLVIAITLWYLITTLATMFGRIPIGDYRIPRPLCLLASLLSFFLLGWLLVNFLSGSIRGVVEVIPEYQSNIALRLANLPIPEFLNIDEESGGLSGLFMETIDLPSQAASLIGSFTEITANAGLILIYIGFLFLEQGNFNRKIAALANGGERARNTRQMMSRIGADIQKYISIKVFTSLLTGTLSYIFLRLVDIDFAGVWGLLIFLLNFIPTVGSIVATIFPALIALAQDDGYALFVGVLIGIGLLQVFVGNILEPRLMGSSFNLSPLVILFNLALWNMIWGIPGMFLCVPILIITTIVLSYFPHTRPIAVILSSDGSIRSPDHNPQGLFGGRSAPTTNTEID